MKLYPNTLKGLTWGLTNFDGVEFDLRLTKDNKLVIFHDPITEGGDYISDLTLDEIKKFGIPSLLDFLNLNTTKDLLNEGKKLWIELKANCQGKNRIVSDIVETIYTSFMRALDETTVSRNWVNIIGFAQELIKPFTDEFKVYPLLPDINECSPSFTTLKAMPQFFIHSLLWHMEKAVENGFAGLLFARQYVMGWMSLRHPSYEKLIRTADQMNLELGTNLGTPKLEKRYKRLHRFSDKLQEFPRLSEEKEGDIIAHRGTGTKGVEIPEDRFHSTKI